MKAKEVSVMVVNLPDNQIYINVTMKVRGTIMGQDGKIQENVRRAKAKEIQRLIEGIEFDNDGTSTVVGHE